FGANAPSNGAAPAVPPADDWKAVYYLVDTPEEFERFYGKLNVQKRFAIDTETTGLDPLQSDLVGLSFCWKQGEPYYLPVRTPQTVKITELIGEKSKKKPQLRMDEVPARRVADYSGEDADVAWRLCETLEPQLESLSRDAGVPSLRKLYQDLEVPLIEVLAAM